MISKGALLFILYRSSFIYQSVPSRLLTTTRTSGRIPSTSWAYQKDRYHYHQMKITSHWADNFPGNPLQGRGPVSFYSCHDHPIPGYPSIRALPAGKALQNIIAIGSFITFSNLLFYPDHAQAYPYRKGIKKSHIRIIPFTGLLASLVQIDYNGHTGEKEKAAY